MKDTNDKKFINYSINTFIWFIRNTQIFSYSIF